MLPVYYNMCVCVCTYNIFFQLIVYEYVYIFYLFYVFLFRIVFLFQGQPMATQEIYITINNNNIHMAHRRLSIYRFTLGFEFVFKNKILPIKYIGAVIYYC